MFMLGAMFLFPACSGMFDGIYDEPEQKGGIDISSDSTSREGIVISGQIYIDASSWKDWYYIDLQAMVDSVAAGKTTVPQFAPWPIPNENVNGSTDTTSANTYEGASPANGKPSGIYTYWFDVWGKGVAVNEFRSFMPTVPQPEPEHWTLAVHRNNVRTNGGGVYETALTDISLLDFSRGELAAMTFTADTWSETVVWAEQSQMLNSLIGSQGIAVNTVLSSWLRLEIPPMPPAFTHNDHVFILRLSDGTYAALQLEDYLSPQGTKCCLTINYRYPI